ncbi:preprotein translocase subunit SecE [Nocardia stercoris]|uniref:Protein translocase subunit SecE n=1 Tax=Nocardia stercoris TaxID=2483361 RepID=A0A3M2L318_9NOCA|nr:preprotein translocase subunit SecE [Nocardia stercoris]RMI30913.1 preprotein translocase subunit SecE [Nocardia stercoris]
MGDERDIRRGVHDADQGEPAAAVSRPSGKRSSRRTRVEAAGSDSGSVATLDRPSGKAAKAGKGKQAAKKADKGSGNPIQRLIIFLREVVAELRKVIWPNRNQMVTYTVVVLVFVIFTVAFIAGLDIAFTQGVNWLFG